MSHNETVTQTLTGNGLVIERSEKTGAKIPWHWIRDEHKVSKTHSHLIFAQTEAVSIVSCK